MRTIHCDFCGDEVTNNTHGAIHTDLYQSTMDIYEHFDTCAECYEKIHDLIINELSISSRIYRNIQACSKACEDD